MVKNKRLLGMTGAVPEELYAIPLGVANIVAPRHRRHDRHLRAHGARVAGCGRDTWRTRASTARSSTHARCSRSTSRRSSRRSAAPTGSSSCTRPYASAASAPRSPRRSRSMPSTTSTPRWPDRRAVLAGPVQPGARSRILPDAKPIAAEIRGLMGTLGRAPPERAPSASSPTRRRARISAASSPMRRPTSDSAKIGIVRRASSARLDGGADQGAVAPDCRMACRTGRRRPAGAGSNRDRRTAPTASLDTIMMARPSPKPKRQRLIVLGWRRHPSRRCHRLARRSDGRRLDRHEQRVSPTDRGDHRRWPVTAARSGRSPASVPLDHASARCRRFECPVVSDGRQRRLGARRRRAGRRFVPRCPGRLGRRLRYSWPASLSRPASGSRPSLAWCIPLGRRPGGVPLVFGVGGRRLRGAPLRPGASATSPSVRSPSSAMAISVDAAGPGVLSFDGERDHILRDGESACYHLPLRSLVIDPERLAAAARAVPFPAPSCSRSERGVHVAVEFTCPSWASRWKRERSLPGPSLTAPQSRPARWRCSRDRQDPDRHRDRHPPAAITAGLLGTRTRAPRSAGSSNRVRTPRSC